MRFVPFLILAAACENSGGSDPHQHGGQGATEPMILECDVTTWAVERDEVLPGGFTAAEAVAAIEGTAVMMAEDEAGEDVEIHMSVLESAGELTYTERFYEGDAEDFGGCEDTVDIPVTLLFASTDGGFEFEVEMNLSVESLDTWTVSGEMLMDANEGTHEVEVASGMTASNFLFEHYGVAGQEFGELAALSGT